MARIPALIMTPHSSGFVPFNILADMLGEGVHDPEACAFRREYLFNEGDPFTDALFYTEDATHVHALVSRFVVDLNRKRDEGGLNGVLKLTDFGGVPLYQDDFRFSEKRIEERLSRFYDPFHETLDRMLAKDDIRFFVDGHSMTATGPVIGPDAGRPRPAFTLMTGGDTEGEAQTHTEPISIPAELARQLRDLVWLHFKDIIQDSDTPDTVLLNDPFAKGGTISRLSHPKHKGSKPGFGLEFNRALYLQTKPNGLDEPIPERIPLLNTRFQAFMKDCSEVFDSIGAKH